jgi:ribonucleoside-diphosphate reductase alpha chain
MYWLNKESIDFLRQGYIYEWETPEQRIKDIANTAEGILGIEGFADKFYGYMERGFFSLSSPVWANFGRARGLPISCFGSYVPDSVEGILDTASEVGMMTKLGGGTSAYFGDVRCAGSPISHGGKSEGSVSFMRIFESVVNVCKQSDVRRGSFAAYLPIDHGDIREFLKIRTRGNSIQHIFPAVTVPDYWMEQMIAGDSDKREIWAEVIKARTETGTPYVFFTDNVQKNRPLCYSQQFIRSSNLCSEIALPVGDDESFVCCLSSLNLLHWEEIKETDAIQTLTFFLDAVMEEFIRKSEGEKHLARARKFAIRHRALGLGVLGWHSYLQRWMIPFESMLAKSKTSEIFKKIKEDTYAASETLANMFGKAEACLDENRRNTTTMAVAPTKSSSFILGQVSQSVEPEFSNYHVKNRAKIRHSHKNPYLEALLADLGKDTEEVWDSILLADGSVQHLDFLNEQQKDVFKTFGEISQKEIVIQAAIRQKYIDQAQSLNLMIHPDTSVKEINKLMIYAWQEGVKTLYYQHSINAAQALMRDINSCKSCEA